jgi:hypothetical protein
LGDVLAYIFEDVGVPPEGPRRVGVAEHPGDIVERDTLPQGQGAGGVAQVVEADLYRETRLLEELPEEAHHGVAPADLALRVRDDPLLSTHAEAAIRSLLKSRSRASRPASSASRLGAGD